MLTKNHQLVLEIVRESGFGHHRCASDIFAEAKRRRPSIGHTTIYRSLARLRDLRLVREVVLPHGNSATYEPMGPDTRTSIARGAEASKTYITSYLPTAFEKSSTRTALPSPANC